MHALEQSREEIDRIDTEMAKLFERRMETCREIAAYKKEHDLPITDPEREAKVLESGCRRIGDPQLQKYYAAFLQNTMFLSRAYQAEQNTPAPAQTPALFVRTTCGAYPVYLSRGLLSHPDGILPKSGKALIVTDDGVPAEYAGRIAAACADPVILTLPHGEKTKNPEALFSLLSALLSGGFTRSDCVISVGGGVVGDLSGLAAALYLRGIAFYNVPTTLLSQVDSSIGGKVAIDLDGIKNAVGAFYPPKAVLIDPEVLTTLEPRQRSAGCAEIIKIAATSDAALFTFLENTAPTKEETDHAILRALRLKQEVVEKDPEEAELRRVLNFGHTIGHAVESRMEGTLLHGECVGIGMLPMCSPQVRERIRRLLVKYGLPTFCGQQTKDLLPLLRHDKKADGSGIVTVLVEQIGCYTFRRMTPEEIAERIGDTL